MRLSKAQNTVLEKMKQWRRQEGNESKWRSAYELSCSLSTLRALQSKGLVTSKSGVGCMFSPRTDIEWRLKA